MTVPSSYNALNDYRWLRCGL